MCLRYRQIYNPSSHFHFGQDKRFILVPCGECEECMKSVKNEWYIRCYAEFKQFKTAGGRTMFVTLTHDFAHMPTFPKKGFEIYDEDGDPQKCFDYDDIKSFVQTMKVYLQRSSRNNSCEGFRYIVCPEYGHDYVYRDRNGVEHKGKKMPHYHVLLFFPRSMASISNAKLKRIVENAWHRGFVLYSKLEKGGAFVDNVKAISYVSKYCSKDFGFYNLANMSKYYDELKLQVKYAKGTESEEELKEKLKNFRKLLPRHYQSTNFGYDYLKYCFVRPAEGCTKDCPKYEISDTCKDAISKGVKPDLCDHYYKIPRYVFNKLCYQYKSEEEGGFRYLTPLGKEIMQLVATLNVAEKAKYYEELITPLGIHKFCTDVEFIQHFKMSPYDFVTLFWTKMNGRTFEDLVYYELVYKDVVKQDNFDYFNQFTAAEYSGNAADFYLFRLDRVNDVVNTYQSIFSDVKRVLTYKKITAYEYRFNDLDAFEDFDLLLGYIAALKSYRIKMLKAQNAKEQRNKLIREKYNNNGLYAQTQKLC